MGSCDTDEVKSMVYTWEAAQAVKIHINFLKPKISLENFLRLIFFKVSGYGYGSVGKVSTIQA